MSFVDRLVVDQRQSKRSASADHPHIGMHPSPANPARHQMGASEIIGSLRSTLSTDEFEGLLAERLSLPTPIQQTFKIDPRNKNRPVVCHPAESTNPENPDSDSVRPKILDAPRSPRGASEIIGSLRSTLSTDEFEGLLAERLSLPTPIQQTFKIDPRNKNRPV